MLARNYHKISWKKKGKKKENMEETYIKKMSEKDGIIKVAL